jgi:ABC-type polysaccharide/polyol phosphate export permease
MTWQGDYSFLLHNLILKDFRIRYRSMSLGVFWSLLNPLVFMGVLTFVFTRIFLNDIPYFALFVLCGIVPFNFFTLAWSGGTSSLWDNAGLVKRVPIPREIIPIASVLSNCVHLVIQIALLLGAAVVAGPGFNLQWLWLPLLWAPLIVAICGLSLLTSCLSVFNRDTRYVVESLNTVLFWLVPIFYAMSLVPAQYRGLYLLNPVAVLTLCLRSVLIEAKAPPLDLLLRLLAVSGVFLLMGLAAFRGMKGRLHDYL